MGTESIKHRTAFITDVDKKNFNETRTITFIASTNDIDRHGTRLNQEGWSLESFRNNPIIGYQHNVYGDGMCEKATPDDIIGRGNNIRVENGQLLVDIEFKPEGRSELADKVAEDVRDGFLNTVSVGFLPRGKGEMVEEEDGREVFHFDGQELLEISVVNIPSNAQALKKSLRDQTARGIMWVKRALGHDYSFADIEKMTVRDILDALDGDTVRKPVEDYNKARKIERLKLINKQLKIG